MELEGRTIRLHLSPEGKRALKGLLPAIGSFQALVIGAEDLGLLIQKPLKPSKEGGDKVPVMLMRWDYIATLSFDYRAGEPTTHIPIGFVSRGNGRTERKD